MANLSADLNENDGQNEQRTADRADAEAQREAREAGLDEMYFAVRQDFVSQEQEHWEFEAGAENMERAYLRREAEEEARRESESDRAQAEWEAEHYKVVAAWGRVGGAVTKGDRVVGDVGTVYTRGEDGSCWVYVGTNGSRTQEFPGKLDAFRARVMARGFINLKYWRLLDGPGAQETSPSAEYRDANG